MPKCSFCKRNYDIPKGLTIFTIDGKSLYYCSSKCRKNVNLGRDPKRVNWIRKDKKSEKKIFVENSEYQKKFPEKSPTLS